MGGKLSESGGFFSADSGDMSNPDYLDSGEALGLVDKMGEAWTFNIITGLNATGAIWAAQRLPSNAVHVNANDLTIGALDLSDSDNFLASQGILDVARSTGWGVFVPSPTGPRLHFSRTFAAPANVYINRQYVTRRLWRVYSLIAPSQAWDSHSDSFPIAVVPDKKLSLDDVFNILRDYYQGTDFDLSKGLAAGPFGNPMRYDTSGETNFTSGYWERAIAIDRGLFSFVAMSRPYLPDFIGSAVWYGWDWTVGTAFHPLYVSSPELPDGYDVWGRQSKYEPKSSWRVFNFLNNWSLLRFDLMSHDIRAEAEKWEKMAFEMARNAESLALTTASASVLQEYSIKHARALVSAWWELSFRLIAMYSNNYKLTGEGSQDWLELGYPDWWLNATEFVAYPHGDELALPLKSELVYRCAPEQTAQLRESLTMSSTSEITLTTLWGALPCLCFNLCCNTVLLPPDCAG